MARRCGGCFRTLTRAKRQAYPDGGGYYCSEECKHKAHAPSTTSGSALAKIRVEAGLTQKQLAEKVGCHPSTICRVEHGKKDLDLLSWVRISSALQHPIVGLRGSLEGIEAPDDPVCAWMDATEASRYQEALALLQGRETEATQAEEQAVSPEPPAVPPPPEDEDKYEVTHAVYLRVRTEIVDDPSKYSDRYWVGYVNALDDIMLEFRRQKNGHPWRQAAVAS